VGVASAEVAMLGVKRARGLSRKSISGRRSNGGFASAKIEIALFFKGD
jgi:hypothetical protein